MQGFWGKYYPKRSEGVEIFSKTQRAPTLQDNEDTELLLRNEGKGGSWLYKSIVIKMLRM
jgi:hypothetical protein